MLGGANNGSNRGNFSNKNHFQSTRNSTPEGNNNNNTSKDRKITISESSNRGRNNKTRGNFNQNSRGRGNGNRTTTSRRNVSSNQNSINNGNDTSKSTRNTSNRFSNNSNNNNSHNHENNNTFNSNDNIYLNKSNNKMTRAKGTQSIKKNSLEDQFLGPLIRDPENYGYIRMQHNPVPIPHYMLKHQTLFNSNSFNITDWDRNNQAMMAKKEAEFVGDPQTLFEEFQELRTIERSKMESLNLVDAENAKKSLSDALIFRGTCLTMCPVYERVERVHKNQVSRWERDPNTNKISPLLALKTFMRPSGQPPSLPSDVRPPKMLVKTLNYITDNLLDKLPECQSFIWDRTRSIRQDFTFQNNYSGIEAIECHEKICRIHLLSLHIMAGSNDPDYQQQQEVEQFENSLQTLTHMYDDIRSRGGNCPNEAEFRAYELLLKPKDTEIERKLHKLSDEIYYDPVVQRALMLRGLILQDRSFGAMNLYSEFFKSLFDSNTPFLCSCLLEIHFNEIRFNALKTMSRSFHTKGKHPFLEYIVDILGYNNADEFAATAKLYELTIIMDESRPRIDISSMKTSSFKPSQKQPYTFRINDKIEGRSPKNIVNAGKPNIDLHLKVDTTPNGITPDIIDNSNFVQTNKDPHIVSSMNNPSNNTAFNNTAFNDNASNFDSIKTPITSQNSISTSAFMNPTVSSGFSGTTNNQTNFGFNSTPSAFGNKASAFGSTAPALGSTAPSPSHDIPAFNSSVQTNSHFTIAPSDIGASNNSATSTFKTQPSQQSFNRQSFSSSAETPAPKTKSSFAPTAPTASSFAFNNPTNSNSSDIFKGSTTKPVEVTVGNGSNNSFNFSTPISNVQTNGQASNIPIANFGGVPKIDLSTRETNRDFPNSKNSSFYPQKITTPNLKGDSGSVSVNNQPLYIASTVNGHQNTSFMHNNDKMATFKPADNAYVTPVKKEDVIVKRKLIEAPNFNTAALSVIDDILTETIGSNTKKILSNSIEYENIKREKLKVMNEITDELYNAFMREQIYLAFTEAMADNFRRKHLGKLLIDKTRVVSSICAKNLVRKQKLRCEIDQFSSEVRVPFIVQTKKAVNSRESSLKANDNDFLAKQSNSLIAVDNDPSSKLALDFENQNLLGRKINMLLVGNAVSSPSFKWISNKLSLKKSNDAYQNIFNLYNGARITVKSLPYKFGARKYFKSPNVIVLTIGCDDISETSLIKKLEKDAKVINKVVEYTTKFNKNPVSLLLMFYNTTNTSISVNQVKEIINYDSINKYKSVKYLRLLDMSAFDPIRLKATDWYSFKDQLELNINETLSNVYLPPRTKASDDTYTDAETLLDSKLRLKENTLMEILENNERRKRRLAYISSLSDQPNNSSINIELSSVNSRVNNSYRSHTSENKGSITTPKRDTDDLLIKPSTTGKSAVLTRIEELRALAAGVLKNKKN
ncbi:hypothetical protein B5S28_g1357 [[Candida] boidinii]|nr:hypothetical protein B5S28_g1357 [[Candida] boidinii]OWB63821.1 hypothetical protein B5S29_g4833 [[Candida] boidinii]